MDSNVEMNYANGILKWRTTWMDILPSRKRDSIDGFTGYSNIKNNLNMFTFGDFMAKIIADKPSKIKNVKTHFQGLNLLKIVIKN